MLATKLTAHAADGLAVVGILTDDPASTARAFIRDYGATWPTVDDPDKTIKTAYRVVGRPTSYFLDRAGVVRKIQIGAMDDTIFEQAYALISAGATSVAP